MPRTFIGMTWGDAQNLNKYHDVEGGETDAGQLRGTNPEVFSLFACPSETFLCQISTGKGYRPVFLNLGVALGNA